MNEASCKSLTRTRYPKDPISNCQSAIRTSLTRLEESASTMHVYHHVIIEGQRLDCIVTESVGQAFPGQKQTASLTVVFGQTRKQLVAATRFQVIDLCSVHLFEFLMNGILQLTSWFHQSSCLTAKGFFKVSKSISHPFIDRLQNPLVLLLPLEKPFQAFQGTTLWLAQEGWPHGSKPLTQGAYPPFQVSIQKKRERHPCFFDPQKSEVHIPISQGFGLRDCLGAFCLGPDHRDS